MSSSVILFNKWILDTLNFRESQAANPSEDLRGNAWLTVKLP